MEKEMSSGRREGGGRSRGERDRATAVWERALEEERREREQERLRWLCRAKEELARFFQSKQVEKVYLTGSLLREGEFYAFSDIDLAVAGLKEGYFKLLVDLEELMGRWVDIIELQKCRFRDQIEKRGSE
jgi:predicted nucleotidyltransferase